MRKTPFDLRSAYGQLVALVFLPIVILAMVGGFLVFREVRQSALSEQDALASSALLRYETVLTRHFSTASAYANTDDAFALNIPAFDEFFHKISPKQVRRMAIFDHDYHLLASYGGHDGDIPFDGTNQMSQVLRKYQGNFNRYKTSYGTSYGRQMIFSGTPYYVVVEMNNDALTITSYRVVLALTITGLTTLLLLLLILNIYSKRWIAPIYEMRLFLQQLNSDNLDRPLKTYTDGEFSLLQRDFVQATRRLSASFNELKAHAKETENDLQHALDEMEMQTISIRQARDLAVSSSHAKSAFLANISHELRTPLNSIDGFINLLARHDGLTAEQSLYVQTIKKSSAHLLALVNDVLDFSKLEADKLILDSHDFDLYATIYDVVDMLSPMALEKHLRLSVLFYNDVPVRVMGDSLRVKQILTNLVGNAIKFTDTGGVVVRVGISDIHDNHLNISVEDTGKGVSDNDKALLFKSFSQGDLSVTRRYGGTGLGLVISKQLTELMGGTIGFYDNNSENIANTGATFWFEIPIILDKETGGQDVAFTATQDASRSEEMLHTLSTLPPMKLLVWINHAPAIQSLKATLAGSQTDIHFAIGFADLLEQLDKTGQDFDWVIVDYFGQDASLDDVGAILRQIRSRYQGKLCAYGYQVGMDNALLDRYQTHPLYEPMDRRQLIAMLTNEKSKEISLSKFSGCRVLAVDDHLPNLLVLEALLGELDVAVITAHNGFDAIETMTHAISTGERIDLIFMDIQMPKMSGLEASIQIRKIEENHHQAPTPIIALTAHGLSDEKERLVAAGLDDYVSKPIGHEQLVQTLTKWLDLTGQPALAAQGTVNFQQKARDDIKRPDMAVHDTLYQTGLINTIKSPDKPSKSDKANKEKLIKSSHALPDIDWQDALARSAHKDDLAKTLLTLLIESSESEKLSLERAWADRDRTALADITHGLVGTSRYTGAPRLRATAEDFEQKCRANLSDTSAGQFISIRPSYRALIDALESLENVDIEAFLAKEQNEHNDENALPWKMI